MNLEFRQFENQRIWTALLGNIDLREPMAFTEIWRSLCTHLAPAFANSDWDVVRIEFWTETGKIAIYPHKLHFNRGIAPGVLEVKSYWLRDFAYERIHSDFPVERAEIEIEQLEKQVASAIAVTAEKTDIPKMLGRSSAKLFFCMPNDDESFEETTIHSS